MKDMAQLRLQAEVSQLEGCLETAAESPSLPPYLVPDATALTDNLHHIRQLTHSARFIIIIPLAGKTVTKYDHATHMDFYVPKSSLYLPKFRIWQKSSPTQTPTIYKTFPSYMHSHTTIIITMPQKI